LIQTNKQTNNQVNWGRLHAIQQDGQLIEINEQQLIKSGGEVLKQANKQASNIYIHMYILLNRYHGEKVGAHKQTDKIPMCIYIYIL
jgi:hypothetical protein